MARQRKPIWLDQLCAPGNPAGLEPYRCACGAWVALEKSVVYESWDPYRLTVAQAKAAMLLGRSVCAIRFNPLGAELATVPYGAEPPHNMILLASHRCGRPPLSGAPVKPPAHHRRPQPDLGEALRLGKEDSRCVMPRLF